MSDTPLQAASLPPSPIETPRLQLTALAIRLAERGLLPDCMLRVGIRRLLQERLHEIAAADCALAAEQEAAFAAGMDASPIAPLPELANAQHYEVPAEFFATCLGPHRKYSCCYWEPHTSSLEQAEAQALALTCAHAELQDGQNILELGCGWGSLTLWMAQHYPASRITAVSNSNSQREFIEQQAVQRGLRNIRVITCDMNVFQPANYGLAQGFDRIVSVEMFEHMRNYRTLFALLHDWLVPGGKFFMHIFVNRQTPYAFEVQGADDWMSQHFFSGGIMPCDDLPLRFQQHLQFVRRWRWDGTHYAKTSSAWLRNMDAHATDITPILQATYGAAEAEKWRMRWRLFYLAVEELFAARKGQEWWVSHYLFERPSH
jgi:cyclopropane-fatty-acyl-phospholipid synthase